VKEKYQRKERKSNHKFEIVRGQELLVQVPLPMAEVWAEMQAQVEELTGQAGLQILRAILENEVTRRVGPPHRTNPTAGCVRWGKQPGYVVFAGQKIPLERPRVRTREGQEVELESYGQLQQDGKLQRAMRERMVAGLSTPSRSLLKNWPLGSDSACALCLILTLCSGGFRMIQV
jgi:putative transposase